eukprot:c8842_g1_i1 orf=323-1882(-)
MDPGEIESPRSKLDSNKVHGHVTSYVIISCIMAASAGLMFGYNIGISGGIASMDDFLEKFFPIVYNKKRHASESNYCKFNDEKLQAFTSSLYFAGLIATFVASQTTKRLGRKATMIMASIFYIVGVGLTAGAQNLSMLITGRIVLGCGVGFGNQAAPIYLSEMAPAQLRGGLNIMFQLNTTIGVLFANLVNYGTQNLQGWGWRLSLGVAGIPSAFLCVGCLMLVDTPNSLIERGHLDKGKSILCKIRGTQNVDVEFNELVRASQIAQEVKNPFRNLLKKKNSPQLTISILLQVFQQFTGINAIMFYSPVLFQTLAFGSDAALYSTVITGVVNVLATVISILTVDRFGRRMLLLEAGIQMLISQVVIAVLLGIGLKDTGDLSHSAAIVVVLMVCVFVSGFAWSWGPMGWLIPSEIFPLEIRSFGQSIVVCTNLLFTFVIAQAFLSMLCWFKYAIFLFFSVWVFIMSAFVFFFLPETKNISIDAMVHIWRQHWFWKIIIQDDSEDVEYSSEIRTTLLGREK